MTADQHTPRWRHLVDGAASIAVVIVCLIAAWKLLSPDTVPGARAPRQPSPRQEVAAQLPTEPVSLEGAKLRGNPSAPIAVIEYSDFQCPYCATYAREVKPTLISTYVDSGKVLMAFRHLPLSAIHPTAQLAAEASECANERNKFWELHDLFFRNQSSLTAQTVREYARSTGIEIDLHECSSKYAARVLADARTAEALGVSGTPTFLIGTLEPNQHVKVLARLTGAAPFHRFRREIERLLTTRGAP